VGVPSFLERSSRGEVMARLGVCSWSLQPTSPEDLVDKVRATGLTAIQLDLTPLVDGVFDPPATLAALDGAGIAIVSTMMTTLGEDYSSLESIRRTGGLVPDDHWNENHSRWLQALDFTQASGASLITFHAGFLPSDPADASYRTLGERIATFAEDAQVRGLRVGLETGQEEAAHLLEFLSHLDAPNLGINFDPANMILYGMGKPGPALRILLARTLQMHIKDALPSRQPGAWGEEVPVGEGAVDWDEILELLRRLPRCFDLLIEREAGGERIRDIIRARDFVRTKGFPIGTGAS